MIEEVWEAATGRWGLVAVVLMAMPGSRKMLRTVAKEAVRAGITICEGLKDLTAELKEEANDVVAEVQAERKQEKHHVAHKAS